jgi:PAS domain S-box-containing protein
VVAISLAAFARWLLPGALAPAPYLGFYPAVVVAAALGGVGPGLAATFGALILVNFVFGHFDLSDSGSLTRQLIWVTASVGVSLLAGMQRQARLRERRQAAELRRWNDELEARVEQRTTKIVDASSTDYFVSVVDDITARKEAAIELAESRTRLSGVVESAMDAIISIDPRQNVVLFNSAAESMFQRKAADVIGRPLDQLLPRRFTKRHAQHVDAFAKTGVSNRAMGSLGALRALRADGSEFPIEASISQTSIGGEKLFTAIVRDITERQRAEDMQRLLLAELDHRVKNALATVQAIAMQTLDAKMEPAAFVEAFSGRIQALGRAHGLLSRSGWRGADLAMLVNEQLMLGSGADSRISARGPHIMIEPQAALHLGLVLHELGSNARKYGCLSNPQGRLATEWWMNGDSGAPTLRLRWSESDGPPVTAPKMRGFGTILIERSLRYALGGEAKLNFAPGGVTCNICLPMAKAGQGAYSVTPSEGAS